MLPISAKGKIALIGPMANARNNMCGMWSMMCNPSKHRTLLEGMRSVIGNKGKSSMLKEVISSMMKIAKRQPQACAHWTVEIIKLY